MNVRAKCVNPECEANGIEKSVVIGQVLGYGAANDRVKCPIFGELMQTTQTSAGDPKRLASHRRQFRRQPPPRGSGRR